MSSVFTQKNRVTVASTFNTSPAVNTTGCNFLSVFIACSSSLTASVTDSQGNTWTQHSSSPQSVAGVKGYVYVCVNPITSASHTFTVTLSSSDFFYYQVKGHSGRSTSTPIEGQGFAGDSSGVTSHAGGVTGAITAGDDVVAYVFDNNFLTLGQNDTWTPGSGFTMAAADYASDGRTTFTGGIEYINNVGTGSSVTGAWTSGLATIGGSFIMALKAAGVTSFTLTAAFGVFTINGQNATLLAPGGTFTLLASSGTYDIVGSDSLSTFQIDAATGAFLLNGQTVSMLGPGGVKKYGVSASGVSTSTQAATTKFVVSGPNTTRDTGTEESLP